MKSGSFGQIDFIKLSSLKNKIQGFDIEIRKFAQNVLNQEKYKNVLIAYNIENLQRGIRPDGSEIEKIPVGRQKSTRYERYTQYLKAKRGDISDVVTLKDKGVLYANIDVKIGYNVIYIIDTDPKSEQIESIWGQFLGVSEEQLFEFVELITPEFERWAKRYFEQ